MVYALLELNHAIVDAPDGQWRSFVVVQLLSHLVLSERAANDISPQLRKLYLLIPWHPGTGQSVSKLSVIGP